MRKGFIDIDIKHIKTFFNVLFLFLGDVRYPFRKFVEKFTIFIFHTESVLMC